jgi:hypothetical protein
MAFESNTAKLSGFSSVNNIFVVQNSLPQVNERSTVPVGREPLM